MKDVKLAVGRKVFGFKCDERDVQKLNDLSSELNKMVNTNTVKYRGLSEDNIFLLTAFELLDATKKNSPTDNVIEREIVKEIIKEVSKQQIPALYHPYPKINNSNWSMDLFGQDINNDAQVLDILLARQIQIDKEINAISDYLNTLIISFSNFDK